MRFIQSIRIHQAEIGNKNAPLSIIKSETNFTYTDKFKKKNWQQVDHSLVNYK